MIGSTSKTNFSRIAKDAIGGALGSTLLYFLIRSLYLLGVVKDQFRLVSQPRRSSLLKYSVKPHELHD